MHIGDLDIVVCVRVDVGVHARLRLERLEIVCVRLEHILDELLHCICKIYCHFNSPFLFIFRAAAFSTDFNLTLFLHGWKYCFLIKR